MTDRTLTCKLPTPGPRQLPIAGVLYEMRVSDQFPWTPLETIPADQPQELILVDVNPGQVFYRATAIDTAGQKAENPPIISAEASFDLPSNVFDFTATDS